MSLLRISLFGGVRVTHEDYVSETKITRTVQGLLAYLLLYRQRVHPREVLAGLFWGDYSEDRARGCLSTALWRLRNALEPDGVPRGTYLMTTPSGEIGFNCAGAHWLDVEVFEEQAGHVLHKSFETVDGDAIAELEKALELYTAELLEGFYDDWALRERERLRCLYLNNLAYLMHYHQHHGNHEESLAYGQQILRYDPLREEIHRDVMRLYVESGQRALAVRQYEACRETLATELGVPPMAETEALYAQIVPETSHHATTSTPGVEPAAFSQALQQLQLAMQKVNVAQEQLQSAIQIVERLAQYRE